MEFVFDGRQADTNYKIKIFKIAEYTSVTFAGQKEYITITGSQIRITNFSATGKISSDGNRIDWSDRTYWIREGAPPPQTLNSGTMNGTYRLKKNDGTPVAGIPPIEIT